ncbi:MAG: hypothetical protein PW786_07925 [Arachidicoccus sp.]|nr:hypothetical protein [Arachidicoccus sp.]
MDNNIRYPVLFTIIVYREIFYETLTYKSILESINESGVQNEKFYILIIDNTDIKKWKVEVPILTKNLSVIYHHLPDNPGISIAYNKAYEIASINNFEWIAFFDQDTELPKEIYSIYKKAALSSSNINPIKCPIVLLPNKAILSPAKYKFYHSFLFKEISPGILNIANISCINTGIMISVLFYNQVGQYNERLRLDFCDHDFIERVKKYVKTIEVLPLYFVQNFSSITHSKDQALKRYKFYCRDLKEFKKGRNKLVIFFSNDMLRLIRLTIKYHSFKFIIIRLKSLFS